MKFNLKMLAVRESFPIINKYVINAAVELEVESGQK